MYVCEICQVEFEKYVSFSVHCNRKHKISYSKLKKKYFPKEEKNFKCNRCGSSFDAYEGLRKHTARMHKIKSENFYVEFYLNGINPICECGCGEKVNWNKSKEGFRKYIKGHHNRVHNNYNTESSKLKSANTRRLQYANRERFVWNDGLTKETSDIVKLIGEKCRKENNPERGHKISKTQKQQFKDGIRNNSGINHPMYGKHLSIETIHKIYAHRYMNKLEQLVENELTKNGIPHYFQFFITGDNITKSYDFKIKGKPIILEIDGDYWHGGPGAKVHWKNVDNVRKNDLFKDALAKSKGYSLYRFWESDVKKDPEIIIKKLLNAMEI